MSEILSTADLAEYLSRVVPAQYEALLSSLIPFYIAVLFFVIGTGEFVLYLLRNKLYIFKENTPKLFDIALIIIIIALIIISFDGNNDIFITLFRVISIIVGIVSVICILGYERKTLIFVTAFFWLRYISFAYNYISIMLTDYNQIDDFAPEGIYSVFAAGNYLASELFLYGGLVAVFTIVILAHFYKRRLIMFDLYIDDEFIVYECENCGMPHTNPDAIFCPNCKEKFPENSYIETDIKVLDKPTYCEKCGQCLNSQSNCIYCDISKTFIHRIGKSPKDILKKLVPLCLFFGYLYLIIISGSNMDFRRSIQNVTYEPHNAYVSFLSSYLKDPEFLNNEKRLQEFNIASDNLFRANLECFDPDISLMNYDDLMYYLYYSDAVYSQLQIMEKIKTAVNSNEEIDISGLIAAFDQTVVDEQNALYYGTRNTIGSENIWIGIKNSTIDIFRFLTKDFSVNFISKALIFTSVFAFVLSIILDKMPKKKKRIKTKKTSEKSKKPKNIVFTYIYAGVLVYICVGIVFTILTYFVSGTHQRKFEEIEQKQIYTAVMTEYLDNFLDVKVAVSDINPGRELTTETQEYIMNLIIDRITVDRMIIADRNVPEDFTEFNDSVVLFCNEEIVMLGDMYPYIKSGKLPPRSMINEYETLIENFSPSFFEYIQEAFSFTADYIRELYA